MKVRNGITPIPLPSITDDPRWIGKFSREVRKAITALRDRRPSGGTKGRSKGKGVIPPFHVTLYNVGTDESPVYNVTVETGVVTDHVPSDTADAEVHYTPGNLFVPAEEADPNADPPIVEGDKKKFAITDGQSVCVQVEVLATGAIGHASKPQEQWVEIVVTSDVEGSHYIPPVADDDEGVPGTYVYELAKLNGGELERKMSGSNIEHWRERPMMDNVGAGDGKVLKDYDAGTDNYRFRSLKGNFGTELVQADDQIDIDIAAENVGTGAAVWMEYDGFTDDPPVDPPDEPIKFRTLRGLDTDDPDTNGNLPQIQVTVEDEPGETADPPSQKKTIRIKGNGIKGALIFKDCDDNEITRIAWQDGLIVEPNEDVEILITPCGTPEVPP